MTLIGTVLAERITHSFVFDLIHVPNDPHSTNITALL